MCCCAFITVGRGKASMAEREEEGKQEVAGAWLGRGREWGWVGAGAMGTRRRGGPWCFPGGCAGVKRRNSAAFLSPAACLEAGLAMGLWVGGRQRGGPAAGPAG